MKLIRPLSFYMELYDCLADIQDINGKMVAAMTI